MGDGQTEEVDGELAAVLMACGVMSVREHGSGPSYSEPREGMELMEGQGVSVVRGIEGRPRAAAQAGAYAMACGVGTSCRRAGQGRSEERRH